MKNQKLELTWIGKNDNKKIEPRVLIEDKEKSYGDENTENMLIHGDNLLALKALEDKFTNKIKCIYIDPPYNTGSAFEHYDDNLEHSIWLGLMKKRLEILKKLLSEDGSIWIQIDDEEQAYLKVLCDEVFGRNNFVNMISVNMKNIAGASGGGEDKRLKKNCEYILIYAKEYTKLETFKGAYDYEEISEVIKRYKDEGISWKYTSVFIEEGQKKYITSTVDGDGNEIKIYEHTNYQLKSIRAVATENNITEKDVYYKFANRIIRTTMPQSSIRPRVIQKLQEINYKNDLISIEYIPKTGKNKGVIYTQYYKGEKYNLFAWLSDVLEEKDNVYYKKTLQGTYWDFTAGTKNLTKEGQVNFPNGKKPESLLKRIIEMTTNEGDIILDSFLGSGTTVAVAHKMNRKWIGIEMGEQVYTHCIPRLNLVINNKDKNGITKEVDWQGGGGYKFYELAPSLLVKDKFGNWIISEEYDGNMLIQAICKQEKFDYIENQDKYWKQGKSSENDYIYVTTNYVSLEYLKTIEEDMKENESLLICAKSYQEECEDKYSNITIKKIPQSILNNCEYGTENYNLNVVENDEDNEEDIDE